MAVEARVRAILLAEAATVTAVVMAVQVESMAVAAHPVG